jgi:hypothetical protein
VLSEGGCGVPSLMEALEARRAEVLGEAERLREQIAGLSEELNTKPGDRVYVNPLRGCGS